GARGVAYRSWFLGVWVGGWALGWTGRLGQHGDAEQAMIPQDKLGNHLVFISNLAVAFALCLSSRSIILRAARSHVLTQDIQAQGQLEQTAAGRLGRKEPTRRHQEANTKMVIGTAVHVARELNGKSFYCMPP